LLVHVPTSGFALEAPPVPLPLLDAPPAPLELLDAPPAPLELLELEVLPPVPIDGTHAPAKQVSLSGHVLSLQASMLMHFPELQYWSEGQGTPAHGSIWTQFGALQ
jgi:hypothetical protein